MSTNKPGVILQAYDPSYEAGIGKRSKYEASAGQKCKTLPEK
jgi:hypothetical protein